MTYKHWKTLGRSLTNGELGCISLEVDELSDAMDTATNQDWIDDALARLEELQLILEESLKLKNRSHLKVIRGVA